MNTNLMPLYITAATIGFVHTVFGPDHYLPFVVMSRARKWSLMKTALLTLFCGLGHIMSSIVLGALGILLGIGVMKLELIAKVLQCKWILAPVFIDFYPQIQKDFFF